MKILFDKENEKFVVIENAAELITEISKHNPTISNEPDEVSYVEQSIHLCLLSKKEIESFIETYGEEVVDDGEILDALSPIVYEKCIEYFYIN